MVERKRAAGRRSNPNIRDRVVDLRRVRAGDLTPHPRNWRQHPDRQRRALRALLAEVGYADALLARETDDGSLMLIDGHLRAGLDPEQRVPVLVLDLDEVEAEKLLLTLDPLAGLAEADPAPLAELLDRVETSSSAVRDVLAALARSARLPVVRGSADPDEVPPETGERRSAPGDLWVLGEHRLICGDATEPASYDRLLQGRQVGLLWTDPPYGVAYTGKTSSALTLANDERGATEALLSVAFSAVDGVLEAGASIYVCHPAGCGSSAFASAFEAAGWSWRQTLVWVKDAFVLGRSDYHYRHEPILYGMKPGGGRHGRGAKGWHGGNAQDSVIEIARPKASREHPTMKPVDLIRRCLQNSSRPGTKVLDPFLGSGSTLIACEQEGRRCAGIELDPRYVDVTIARWEAFTGLGARKEDP